MSEPPDSGIDPPNSADIPLDDAELPGSDLEDLLRRRTPARIRATQAGVLMLVLAVLAAVVFRVNPFAPVQQRASVPTPTALPNGPIIILSNVSGGAITLNGKQLPGSPPLTVTFKSGLNTLTMSAPPFVTRICHIDWPRINQGSDGNCDVIPGSGVSQSLDEEQVAPAAFITLSFGQGDLSAAMQSQALDVANAVLLSNAPKTTVPVGDYISTVQNGDGNAVTQRADTPLRAALLADAKGFQDDGDLVANDPSAPNGHSIQWNISLQIEVRWQFTSQSGEIAYSSPSPVALSYTPIMTYDPRSGWSIDLSAMQQSSSYTLSDEITQTACAGIPDALTTLAQQQGDKIDTLHSAGLQGCIYSLLTSQGVNIAYFIARFGALLAADPRAQALLPSIPSAPPSLLFTLDQ